ncbi:hypothetical protein AO286_21740 [Pseudomonas syringae]|uniref:hypothetical protein n=1 Tax=Pseudomonas syringae group TaxID=136849 RepID=UPI000C07736F|nr:MULTISPECIES: hypothetical protein [Pseudomonas syringae group]PHN65672.1 hypothetical protein AO286_21740 [Pseudomonas syringae]
MSLYLKTIIKAVLARDAQAERLSLIWMVDGLATNVILALKAATCMKKTDLAGESDMAYNKPNDVRVSRELLEGITQTCMFTLACSDYEQLRALLAQPADQQGEPDVLIDLVRPNPHSDGLHIRVWHNTGMLEPGEHRLYRHAQPATVKVDEREEFEKVFPLPEGMEWCEQRKQYAGHKEFWLWTDRFEAWQARAKLNGGQA